MDTLRKPLLFLAIALITIIVMVEMGTAAILQHTPGLVSVADAPTPGYGIPSLAILDALVWFTTLLIAMPLFITHRLQGRIQGIATLIFSIILLLLAIRLIFTTLIALTIMVTLLVSPIFGTAAYFALYRSFNLTDASIVLSMLMVLKLLFAGCLLMAQQRFLQNNGLVLIILTTLIATLIVSFLHGMVLPFLISITDAIAGLIVLILAVIWLLIFVIGSLGSILKVVTGSAAAIAR